MGLDSRSFRFLVLGSLGGRGSAAGPPLPKPINAAPTRLERVATELTSVELAGSGLLRPDRFCFSNLSRFRAVLTITFWVRVRR